MNRLTKRERMGLGRKARLQDIHVRLRNRTLALDARAHEAVRRRYSQFAYGFMSVRSRNRGLLAELNMGLDATAAIPTFFVCDDEGLRRHD